MTNKLLFSSLFTLGRSIGFKGAPSLLIGNLNCSQAMRCPLGNNLSLFLRFALIVRKYSALGLGIIEKRLNKGGK